MGIEWQFSNEFSDISVTTGSTLLFVCCASLLLRTLILISPFHFTPQSDGKASLPHLTFFFYFVLCDLRCSLAQPPALIRCIVPH